ncbi:HIT family protein [Nocardia brasiliensis]|uniref:HIT family protein n=1 Tax=Nocardia brasiliensis TaxID=37326 RepID=UPI00313A9EAC
MGAGTWDRSRSSPSGSTMRCADASACALTAVHDVVREIAVAMRATHRCDGVSTRQHNEPAGGQDVWHYHGHLFPRYHGDDLCGASPLPDFAPGEQRWVYTDKPRNHFGSPLGNVNPQGHAASRPDSNTLKSATARS